MLESHHQDESQGQKNQHTEKVATLERFVATLAKHIADLERDWSEAAEAVLVRLLFVYHFVSETLVRTIRSTELAIATVMAVCLLRFTRLPLVTE